MEGLALEADEATKRMEPTLIDFTGQAPPPLPTTMQECDDRNIQISYHQRLEMNRAAIEDELRPIVKQSAASNTSRELGGYALIKRIGKGQFGDVFMAKSSTNGYVAVKCIPKRPKRAQQYSMNQVLRQIQRQKAQGRAAISGDEAVLEMNMNKIRWEILVASRMKHKNILPVLECLDSSISKDIWIAFPWANLGELKWKRSHKHDTLRQWDLALQHKTDVLEFSEFVLRNLANGLLYLSQQGCLHRDVKPSNILLDGASGNVLLSDFGSSLLLPEKLPFEDPNMLDAYQEEVHKIVGTPAFTAPELCNFEAGVPKLDGFKLDIWSLGVTAYCLLENKLPFWGENEFHTFQKIAKDELPKTGNWLHDLVTTKLLEKDPSKRIGIKELVEILQHPRKESGMKKLVSKLRKLSMKKKRHSKQLALDTSTTSEFYLSEYDSDISSTGSFSDEPVQIPGFIERAPYDVQSSSIAASDVSPGSSLPVISPKQTPIPITPKIESSNTSPSPIKIDTPLKNLIRTENTPKKSPTSPIALETPFRLSKNQQASRLASRGTLDFTKYLHSPSKSPDKRYSVQLTQTSNSIEDIRKYLSFAES